MCEPNVLMAEVAAIRMIVGEISVLKRSEDFPSITDSTLITRPRIQKLAVAA